MTGRSKAIHRDAPDFILGLSCLTSIVEDCLPNHDQMRPGKQEEQSLESATSDTASRMEIVLSACSQLLRRKLSEPDDERSPRLEARCPKETDQASAGDFGKPGALCKVARTISGWFRFR